MTHALGRAVPRTRRARTVVAAAVLVVLAAIGGGLYWYLGPNQVGTRFSAVFTESVGIYPGSDVRMLGVPVGAVDSVTPQGTDVRVEMHLDRGIHATPDTKAAIISPSLVSDRYVQLSGVYPGTGPMLADGATIPLSRTATSEEIDNLTNGIVRLTHALGPHGANKNGALADMLNVGAANLGGNGPALARLFNQLGHSTATLSDNRKNLFRTLGNLADFTKTLATNDRSVRGLNQSLAAVSNVLANDRESFTTALADLTNALTTVKGFIQRNRSLISSNVHKLATITATLYRERASLAQALQAAPVAVDNVINSYDPKTDSLVGRGNLNELTLGTTTTTTADTTGGSGTPGPPLLLPTTGTTTVSGGTR